MEIIVGVPFNNLFKKFTELNTIGIVKNKIFPDFMVNTV